MKNPLKRAKKVPELNLLMILLRSFQMRERLSNSMKVGISLVRSSKEENPLMKVKLKI